MREGEIRDWLRDGCGSRPRASEVYVGHRRLKCRSLSAGTQPVDTIRKLVTSLVEMDETGHGESRFVSAFSEGRERHLAGLHTVRVRGRQRKKLVCVII